MSRKNLAVGIVAHVDAGKTTLSEAMLYLSGSIRKLGRVDRGDSFLDENPIERDRGITAFSKTALLTLPGSDITLLDTPGHSDLVCETERTFSVLDYAVMVINGTDGVQAHTETLWSLLAEYRIPCFVFFTKMDVSVRSRKELLTGLSSAFNGSFEDFSRPEEELADSLAMLDEGLMEEYLDTGKLCDRTVAEFIRERKLFPCFFGSGLSTDGVDVLLTALDRYCLMPEYGTDLGARVFKISRDPKGNRLSFMKITGGSLKAKDRLSITAPDGNTADCKADEIRIYSGAKYETVQEVPAGAICAVTGLDGSRPGMGLGTETGTFVLQSEPVMNYTVVLPDGEPPVTVLPKLMQLSEEDPELNVASAASSKVIEIRTMGTLQTELITRLARERFGLNIRLENGRVLYRETIRNKVEGVGHYEPLRHYAEVHLILEPAPPGSGVIADSMCLEDDLDRNWQRLILTHILEREHPGVLTGAPLTDVHITLAAGKAHIKHTEGGDFRQATYRAIRQGLMKAESILLEPYYSYTITAPPDCIGRAIGDVQAMNGEFSGPEVSDTGACVIRGFAPAAQMSSYYETLASYTSGRGRISLRPGGYRPCREQEEIVAKAEYNPFIDPEASPDSVFCYHGAGTVIPWDRVEEHMHLESVLRNAEG